jgi:RNA polymerase sigma factor (TIGR02999 family)
MEQSDERDVTQLLRDWSAGDEHALERLAPLVHKELHRLASRYMADERTRDPLQTTALINEAYLRLIRWKNARWQSRVHFFAVAAQLMRRILVDAARARRQPKRGAGMVDATLDEACTFRPERSRDLVMLDEALVKLARMDPRKSRLVELRFFGGLTLEETATVLQISPRTVRREWSSARAWLYHELADFEADAEAGT